MNRSTKGPARPVIFGEVLFDRFPDGRMVLGGAPFNVAWHLRGLGEDPLLISRVGDDPSGGVVRAAMAGWGMDVAGLETDPVHPTGTVWVGFRDGEPHYEILPDQAYDFIDGGDGRMLIDPPAFLYHGSLALRQPVSRRALETLARQLDCPVFMDVNLRPPWWRAGEILRWTAGADWLKLNGDELAVLVPGCDLPERKARRFLEAHFLRYLVLTQGSEGALALGNAGERATVRPSLAGPVVDTVGAGDAFSAVFLLGRLRGWPLALSLERAQDFASGVVGLRGATVADPDFYRPFAEAWRAA
ncbi:fructokinase [Methylomagnum ishizawai]|uniref:Fructokinase n=1 Tax=Methylomagnum ishizawai TaxID=1760988 RepID=A0A1Y6DB54_9GAMM|nr:PfkB family carbohydrate kinase [Methylomagnum ishizawai]SMF97364.1 fructokinase [Methylomagnum ishizawai]